MNDQYTRPRLPNFYECDACRKNIVSARHYCHDCRAIFCDGCIVHEKESITTCSECGLNLFATDPKTGTLYCKRCADQGVSNASLVAVTREKNACPKCRSGNTSEIDELKASLKEQYKNIIIDCRNVLADFQNFTNFTSLVKQKVLKLRLEAPVMVHDPDMETELLGIMEEATIIERRILNRVNSFFLFLKARKPYFFSGKQWTAEEIPVLETYVSQLQSDFLNFLAQVSESFNQPLDVLCTLKDRAEHLITIKDAFVRFMNKGIVSLERDEYPVFACDGVRLESDQEEHKGHGHLVLTSRHVKFIKTQGIMRKSELLLFSYPVSKLLNTEITGKIFKRLTMQFQGVAVKFSIDKAMLRAVMNYVDQLLDFEKLHGHVNQDVIQRVKQFDVNTIFKIKAFIEQNINSLLDGSPDAFTPSVNHVLDEVTTSSWEPRPLSFHDHHVTRQQSSQESITTGTRGSVGSIFQEEQGHARSWMPPAGAWHGVQEMPGWEVARERRAPASLKPPAESTGDRRSFRPRDAPRAHATHDTFPARPWDDMETPDAWTHGTPSPAASTLPARHDGYAREEDRDRFPRTTQAAPYRARIKETQETRYLVQHLQACEQKQASIKETLRNLEAKFETGKVAPSVYFQTHQLFSEKYISIRQEMQGIKDQLAMTHAYHEHGP